VSDEMSMLLEALDCGPLSRRRLLQTLGAFALAPASALAASAPRVAKRGWIGAPPEPPFEPTGWNTVLLDHLSCRVENYEKEASYYNALMNWAVRDDNGREAVLDIGDWGGIIIRGGYRLSASEVAADRARYERRAAVARTRGFQMGPFVPTNAVFDNVCWGIEPWDARTVETALKARGLNPVPDNRGRDFESFHVKDPDGFDVQISNGNRQNRRTTPARGRLAVAAPFAHTDWKTVWLDHMSYQCSDYRRTVAFYQALLGWQPWIDSGNSNQVRIGDVGDTIIRNHFGGGHGVLIDHISFGIAPFEPEGVKAALEMRGLPASADTGGSEPIETAPYKSYHTMTPNGFDLQVSNADQVNRGES
jgi:catechol 2,3-dioxygenase-like lactoylglutathione lyase family enzyme